MAGVAGQNVDLFGYVFDPTLDQTKQYYKESGLPDHLRGRVRHVMGGFVTVKIPTASMLTLNTVPIQIVPAPGAGNLIVPTLMVASLVFNSAAYSCNASGASLKYGTAGAGGTPGLTITQAFIQKSSGTNHIVVPAGTTAYLPTDGSDTNAPLTLIAASSDPTTGDSDMYVRVYYKVIQFPISSTVANP